MSHQAKLKLDIREILTSTLFGVSAGVLASILERVDAAVTGGNATPLGYTNTYSWLLLSAYLYGPLGALVTTEVQALIGLLTAANPLSWLWPVVNGLFALVAGSTSVILSTLRPNSKVLTRLIIMSSTLALLDIPAVYFVIVLVLGLPVAVYYLALPMYMALQLCLATTVSYYLLKALERSGMKF
ncbi:MAG: hypothetical protein ACUVTM_03690 [Candidatus Bathyarchaeia archaeon]